MTDLQVFKFGFDRVRVVMLNDDPWFVAKDVCEVFGDTNYRRSVARLEDDEKGVSPMYTPGGIQNLTIINESGLYTLLFHMQPQRKIDMSEEQYNSRVNSLRNFKRWVTHEVIPSIRRHGVYMTPSKIEEVLLNPDTIIQLATQLKHEQEEKQMLAAKIEADRPKVIFAEALEISHNAILIGEFAKVLRQNGIDIGQNRLFEWLRDNHYLIKSGEQKNLPTQRAMDMSLFEIHKRIVAKADGTTFVTNTTKVTGKGQEYFINRFKSSFERIGV